MPFEVKAVDWTDRTLFLIPAPKLVPGCLWPKKIAASRDLTGEFAWGSPPGQMRIDSHCSSFSRVSIPHTPNDNVYVARTHLQLVMRASPM